MNPAGHHVLLALKNRSIPHVFSTSVTCTSHRRRFLTERCNLYKQLIDLSRQSVEYIFLCWKRIILKNCFNLFVSETHFFVFLFPCFVACHLHVCCFLYFKQLMYSEFDVVFSSFFVCLIGSKY